MGWFRNWLRIGSETRSATFHPKDPALAELFGIGAGTAAGVHVSPATARECPAVDACVSLIEDTLATIPLDLFERIDDDTRVRCSDHPLHKLLHDVPNDFQTSAEFRQMMEGWRSTYGNAHARIVWRGDGVPEALIPLHPDTCKGFRLSTGKAAYRVNTGNGQEILTPGEILHLKDKPFRRDLLNGQSRVERHKESIGLAMATGQYLSRFFSNNAIPKSFLKTGKAGLSDQQVDLMREQFERKHAGLDNAHRIGVLRGDLDLIKLGIDNNDAQVIETYSLAVAEIARIYNIPLHMIGETSKQTSWGTGIEQMGIGYVVYCMRPKFVMWEQALNRTLMSAGMRERFYFEFNADGLLRGDFKTRMDGYAVMVQWGLASINEIRRRENMPPVDGGDERLHPLAYAPSSMIKEVLMRGNQSGAPGGAAPRSS
jgi:HK97 family phage portal protein